MASLDRAAEVPSLRASGRDADFAALNKHLRCCIVCRLVKTYDQFYHNGCENCQWRDEADADKYSTPNFSGMITIMDPSTSWASKWLHLAKYVPGCYALVVNDDIPDDIEAELADKGLRITHLQR